MSSQNWAFTVHQIYANQLVVLRMCICLSLLICQGCSHTGKIHNVICQEWLLACQKKIWKRKHNKLNEWRESLLCKKNNKQMAFPKLTYLGLWFLDIFFMLNHSFLILISKLEIIKTFSLFCFFRFLYSFFQTTVLSLDVVCRFPSCLGCTICVWKEICTWRC